MSIEVDGKRFDVFKDCRVKIFDAFWITEPIPEEDKPYTVMSASDVPMELWKILTEEERLLSLLAELQRKTVRLERQKSNWLTATLLLGTTCIPLIAALLSRSCY